MLWAALGNPNRKSSPTPRDKVCAGFSLINQEQGEHWGKKKGRADYPPPSQNLHTQLQISNTADVCTALETALYPSVLVGHKYIEFSIGVNGVIHPQGNAVIHPQGVQIHCPLIKALLYCKHIAHEGTPRHKLPRNSWFHGLCLYANKFCNITFNYYPFLSSWINITELFFSLEVLRRIWIFKWVLWLK